MSFIGNFGFKFEGVNYRDGKIKAPIVTDNSVAYIEVNVKEKFDCETHTIINQVEAQRGKKLTETQADYLVTETQAIINSI